MTNRTKHLKRLYLRLMNSGIEVSRYRKISYWLLREINRKQD